VFPSNISSPVPDTEPKQYNYKYMEKLLVRLKKSIIVNSDLMIKIGTFIKKNKCKTVRLTKLC